MTDPLNARQALDGIALPERPQCRDCSTRLRECQPVSIVAERPHDAGEWFVSAAFCVTCAPTTTRPAPAADRILAEGELALVADTAAQEHWPAMIRAVVVETHELAALGVEI